MLMHKGWSCYVDNLRNDICENHNQIHILDFDFYDVDIFNRCQNSSDILMVVKAWNNVHPLLKIIPVEWEYNIPYGLIVFAESIRNRTAFSFCCTDSIRLKSCYNF